MEPDYIQKEDEKYNADLQKRAKKPEDLIVPVYATIKSFDGNSSSTSFTPFSEMAIGGHSPRYQRGNSLNLEMRVETKTPIKRLHWGGYPPSLEVGDTIRAYIVKGIQETERGHSRLGPSYPAPPSHWVSRNFQEEENPFKIEKLRKGKVVATYHKG